jgi:hypothetical protein
VDLMLDAFDDVDAAVFDALRRLLIELMAKK